tara:strand:- start:7 stop:666 length:660 start_codon:yes stop_codon:yes gene_type:complete
MVSISNVLSLALIGGGILAFYKLGGAGGIGSRIGGGFSTLVDSFTSSLNLNSLLPSAAVKQVDPYQTWLDTYGTGDGILDVEKKGEKFCVGGFCFDENPNLAATAPTFEPAPDEATTVNTGGEIQRESQNIQKPSVLNSNLVSFPTMSGGVFQAYTPESNSSVSSGGSWNQASLAGVNITGSYSSSGGGSTGGSSGGSTGGGTSSKGGQGAGRSSNRGR